MQPIARPKIARLLAALLVALLPTVSALADETAGEPDPLDVLVFSQPYGFSHTPSIVAGAEWFLGLNADPERYNVVVARDVLDVEGLEDDGIDAIEWLKPERLRGFDVVVMNNTTGEFPLDDAERDFFVDWVREGHGLLGIHSASDANYTWPAYHELIGGQYDGHWYAFGGIAWEPYRMNLIEDDPDNPLLTGVDPDFDFHDETYRWQLDVRPDVHVLHSMDNSSILPSGALYHWNSPITWCRQVAAGRSFTTNIGHSAFHYADANVTTMLTNALSWAGDRLEADVDCGMEVDAATGIDGDERIGALDATVEGAGHRELSTYSGGLTAFTGLTGDSTVTFPQVDLTDVSSIDLFAAAQDIAPPTTLGITGGLYSERFTSTAGGEISVRLGDAGGPVIATATLRAGAATPATTLPAELAPASGATTAASWSVLTSDLDEVDGVHDLVLTFSPARGEVLGSLAWVRLG